MKKEEISTEMEKQEMHIPPARELELRDFYHQHIHRLNSLRVIGSKGKFRRVKPGRFA